MLRPFPCHHHFSSAAAAAAMRPTSSSSSRPSAGGAGANARAHNAPAAPSSSSASSTMCRHTTSSATFDILILLLVIFPTAFLLVSSLAHVCRALAPLLHTPPASAALASASAALPYLVAALPYLAAAAVLAGTALLSCRRLPRRRCRNPRCRGLRKALEFDVQLQTEEAVRSGAGSTIGGADAAMWREIEALPWKGGQGGNNPDYECLRAELRRMAPPNGRAVLLFRNRCGCPVAKLEGWGAPKSKRRNKR
ncbi:hypothetical protein PR202_gb01109 [Eleusine coracana subsp. coracana]|uniref:Ribosomal protein L34e superfamily protein n=1 Tax=Eleusine coracana subsp. coracana TaxID=191504 RepID=A0AAV5DU91_ELECO|nr:hypothetical protein PR202_gb01109 [Eleusine coracana subsp. coracana]